MDSPIGTPIISKQSLDSKPASSDTKVVQSVNNDGNETSGDCNLRIQGYNHDMNIKDVEH